MTERFGTTELIKESAIVTNLESDWQQAGLSPDAAGEMTDFVRPYEPILSLMDTAPLPSEELPFTTGRGIARQISPDYCVYVRGVGSKRLLQRSNGNTKFPAFPQDVRTLIYDRLSATPRLNGLQSVGGGIVEYMHAMLISTQLSKLYDFKTPSDYLAFGAPVPVGVTHFPELSEYIGQLVAEYRRQATPEEADRLSYPGLEYGFGTVGLAIPFRERVFAEESFSKMTSTEMMDARSHLAEPHVWASIGSTLRLLIACGFAYEFSSAHLQNMWYPEKFTPFIAADFCDLIPLSGYQITDQWAPLVSAALVFGMISRPDDGFIEIDEDTKAHPTDNSHACQFAFWDKLLSGMVHPDAIEFLSSHTFTSKFDFYTALAVRLTGSLCNSRWHDIPVSRHRMAQQYAAFWVPELLTQDQHEFLQFPLPLFLRLYTTQRWKQYSSFLETGIPPRDVNA